MKRVLMLAVALAAVGAWFFSRPAPERSTPAPLEADAAGGSSASPRSIAAPTSAPNSAPNSVARPERSPATARVMTATPPVIEPLRLVQGQTAEGAGPTDAEIWQAVQAVREDAQQAAAVGRALAAPHAGQRNRELAADLLTHAGTAEAQTALRSALDAMPAVPERPALLHRMALVRSPTPETVEWALATHASAKGPARSALSYSLGSLGRRAPDAIDTVRATLRAEAKAEPAWQRAAGIGGLGNLRSPVDTPVLIAAATDPAEAVRRAAARALGHQGEAGQPTIASLLRDAVPGVASMALRAIDLRPDRGLARLSAAVISPEWHAINDAQLVSTLAPHAARPQTREMLRQVEQRASGDPALRARVRRILRRSPAP